MDKMNELMKNEALMKAIKEINIDDVLSKSNAMPSVKVENNIGKVKTNASVFDSKLDYIIQLLEEIKTKLED